MRDPCHGPGLLLAEGQQFSFTIDGIWNSEIPPRAGLVVDVDFDWNGRITGIRIVPEVDASEAPETSACGIALGRSDLVILAASAILVGSWCFLNAVSIETAFGKLNLSFWQLLQVLNMGSAAEVLQDTRTQTGPGFYGVFALIAIAGPFLSYLWRDKRANVGKFFPLVFMAVIALLCRGKLQTIGFLTPLPKEMLDQLRSSVSWSSGVYVAGLVSISLAAQGIRQWASVKRIKKRQNEAAVRAAA